MEGLPPRYRVVGRLASTPTSDVLLAVDELLDREVAVKALRPFADHHQRAEFFRGLQATAGFRHPRVVVVLDAGDPPDGQAWSVLEFFPRGSLADRIRRDGPLPPADVVSIGAALAEVLDLLHEHGVLHRDVKPANVLVADDGDIRLTDFGIATGLHAHTGSVTTVQRSPDYAAPEVDETTRYDVRSEIYSLGVTLVELLAGANPFARRPGETPRGYTDRRARLRLDEELAGLDVPQGVQDLLTAMVATDPADRPSEWSRVRARLGELGPDGPGVHAGGEVSAARPGATGAWGQHPAAVVDGRDTLPRGGPAPAPVGFRRTGPVALAASGGGDTGAATSMRPTPQPAVPLAAPEASRPSRRSVLLGGAAAAILAAAGAGWAAGAGGVGRDGSAGSSPSTSPAATVSAAPAPPHAAAPVTTGPPAGEGAGSDNDTDTDEGGDGSGSDRAARDLVVPDLTGETVATALKILQRAGFTDVAARTEAVADPQQDGRVLDQSPARGDAVGPESPVVLVVGEYLAPSDDTSDDDN